MTPATALIRKRTRKTKKQICAKPTAVDATPPKPNSAAISAMTKKVTAQPSMTVSDTSLAGAIGRPVRAWKRVGRRQVPVRHKKRAHDNGLFPSHSSRREDLKLGFPVANLLLGLVLGDAVAVLNLADELVALAV